MQTKPIDFHPPAKDAAAFMLPVYDSIFAERADRFDELAANHSLGDWLHFLGHITRAQHTALKALPELTLPDAATLEQARLHGMPSLNAGSMPRPAAWRDVLRQMTKDIYGETPQAGRRALDALSASDDARLEKLADTLLSGEPQAADAAELPFVAAALQVVFTALASQLEVGALQRLDAHGNCPCCGSLPVASVVRANATINNLRYLHCSLCNVEWNVPRATCTVCETDKGIALYEIEGAKGAVRAETCDGCKSYLKIMYQEKDQCVDPVADDLATLALDMLVDEAGYARSGPNLLLMNANG